MKAFITEYIRGYATCQMNEVNIAIICSCMPIITAPLKVMVMRITSSWNYLKKETQTLLLPKESTEYKRSNQLPNIPGAKISGLRTFIQRFQRSESKSGETTVAVDMSNFSKLGSINEDYHHQLRAIHENDSANTPRSGVPDSREQSNYGGA